MAATGLWQVPWAPYECREDVAGFLGPVWPPWGRGHVFWPRMAAVEAWPVT